MLHRSSRTHAFTLIELLVVIAIIAVIAAILFPVFATAREKGRQITCTSNIRQLGMAILLYTEDYDDTMPGSYNGDFGVDPGKNKVGGWMYYSEFVDNNPNAKVFDPTLGSIYPYVKNTRVYICPSDSGGETTGNSYALNSCVCNPPENQTTFFATGKPLAKLTNASAIMLLSEEDDPAAGHSTNDAYLSLNFGDGGDTLATRHSGGINVAFADSHIKWYRNESIHPAGFQTGIPGEIPGVTNCP